SRRQLLGGSMAKFRALVLSLAATAVLVSPGLAQSGSFGNSVVIDGDALIIGEPNNSFRPGMVYVYRKSESDWIESARLTAPGAERADGFGAVLALSGSTLFVATRAGSLYTYERSGATWAFSSTLTAEDLVGLDAQCNYNGYCGVDYGISLSADKDWLLVGHSRTATDASRMRTRQRRDGESVPLPPPGTVYAFQRGPDGRWTEQQRIESPAAAPGDAFGAAVSVVGDRLLVGAPKAARNGGSLEGAGRVFEYRLMDGLWREGAELTVAGEAEALFGATIVSSDGRAVIGAPLSGLGFGAAFVFNLDATTGTWSERARLDAPEALEGDVFGGSVALDGDDVWVGAPVVRGLETGMAFVFSDGMVTDMRFTEEETNTEDSFGHRIVAGGGIAAVTASGLDHQAGGVFVYERDDNGTWRQGDVLLSAPDALGAVFGEERRCTEGTVESFDCNDIELLAYIPISLLTAPEAARGIRANDNWGWTDSEAGREYALVGRNDGTSFIDITDPTNPVLIGDLPKTLNTPRSQLWRDIKTYRDHAFIVADGAGAHGMQVFDLTRLRDVVDPPVVFDPDLLYRGDGLNVVESSHNIIINEETGFAYLTSRGCAGMHMVDISEPMEPTFVGCSEPGGTHDAQCIVYRGPDESYR
ncbi:MAG TPA: hypothetical protein DCX61_00445, partial [Gemmatimonadetes bacterium]|nr:hypothetical protein [Gemmatimonadota bacterium]